MEELDGGKEVEGMNSPDKQVCGCCVSGWRR